MKNKNVNFKMVMVVYLLGIFMGALDTGIVTPARTIIQNDLNVSDTFGIWMITIYTLAYAAAIPIMGKLADRHGRRRIYLTSITLFGFGSLLCGLSQNAGSFSLLLISRVIQATGGGGIVPVATAEFGTTFPEEKRGTALGMVGGVYGVANIIGASVGSAILDLFGTSNWQFIFYVNVPISVFIIIAGIKTLPNTKEDHVPPIDIWGIATLTVMILSLMYGLKNIDFFNFGDSMSSVKVYPFLIVFAALIPLFIQIEKRAADPVMNLSYFRKSPIVITLTLSFISGVILMGLVFVPQFCETAMKVSSGNGGYFVIILGVFAGISAPLSGRMIDKIGVKIALGIGLLFALSGSLCIIFLTTKYPNVFTVVLSLVLIGFGIGFTMGAPLNYMMLDHTPKSESNSALATLSLVRSIATVIAPAIMVGFIAHAGMSVQDNIMGLLPDEVNVPKLPYAQELSKNSSAKMPAQATMTKIKINMNSKTSKVKVPDKLVRMMKDSDVTTIVANTKKFSSEMFSLMTPDIIKNIQNGIDSGIKGISTGEQKIQKSIAKMQKAQNGMKKGISGMQTAIVSQNKALSKLESAKSKISSKITAMTKADSGMKKGFVKMKTARTGIESRLAALEKLPKDQPGVAQQIEALTEAKAKLDTQISTMQNKITGVETAISKMKEAVKGQQQGIEKLTAARNKVILKKAKMQSSLDKIINAQNKMETAKVKMQDNIRKMKIMRNAVPGVFQKAGQNYQKGISSRAKIIEDTYQKTLDRGFGQVYATTAVASGVGLILLVFYRSRKKKLDEIKEAVI